MNKIALLSLGLWALTIVFVCGAWIGIQAGKHFLESDALPEAGPRVPQSPERLGALVGTALQYNGQTALSKTVRIHMRETDRFERNFFNIAAKNGWFAHNPDKWGFSVVMPADQITKLDLVSADPIGWILEHRNTTVPAQGPTGTEDLVNVRVDVEQTDNGQYIMISLLAYGAIVGGIISTFGAGCCTWVFLLDRRNDREGKLLASPREMT